MRDGWEAFDDQPAAQAAANGLDLRGLLCVTGLAADGVVQETHQLDHVLAGLVSIGCAPVIQIQQLDVETDPTLGALGPAAVSVSIHGMGVLVHRMTASGAGSNLSKRFSALCAAW